MIPAIYLASEPVFTLMPAYRVPSKQQSRVAKEQSMPSKRFEQRETKYSSQLIASVADSSKSSKPRCKAITPVVGAESSTVMAIAAEQTEALPIRSLPSVRYTRMTRSRAARPLKRPREPCRNSTYSWLATTPSTDKLRVLQNHDGCAGSRTSSTLTPSTARPRGSPAR